ncbi:MAG: heavy metal-associated domain-containing protein [Methanomicrobiales archaeon]
MDTTLAEPERKKNDIKISAINCATCSVDIEESSSGLIDVTKAQVNFGTDTAHVEFDPTKVSLAILEKAVKNAGNKVVNSQVKIKVGGMMCATCDETIESALKELPRIVSATINIGTKKAYVTYNPSLTGINGMKKAIDDAEYPSSEYPET